MKACPACFPGRRHIVLTRREKWESTGAEVAGSVDEALALARDGNATGEIMVVGGAAIYDVFRPLANCIEVTEIHEDFAGDTFMKPIGTEWKVTARDDHPAENGRPAYSFVTYHRHDDASEEAAE